MHDISREVNNNFGEPARPLARNRRRAGATILSGAASRSWLGGVEWTCEEPQLVDGNWLAGVHVPEYGRRLQVHLREWHHGEFALFDPTALALVTRAAGY